MGVYAVAEVDIRYLRPAQLGDDLLVVIDRGRRCAPPAVAIHQRVMRGTEILADATVTAAFLDPRRTAPGASRATGSRSSKPIEQKDINA